MHPGDGAFVRISQDALRGVVFFGGPVPPSKTDPHASILNPKIRYQGTGFVVAYPDPPDGELFPYLVTARHVAKASGHDDQFVVRVNRKGAAAEDLPLFGTEWAYPDDESIDLAVTPYHFDQTVYDIGYFNLNQSTNRKPFVDAKGVTRNSVCCGDEIAIVGLFHLHSGKRRNVPVVHTGHVAVLADPNERIPLKNRITGERVLAEGFLVETQSLDGLSGSPAFIFEWMDLPVKSPEGNHPQAYAGAKLLGVYVGSWDGDPHEVLVQDRRLSDGTKVPVGMGMVVPVDMLLELIGTHPMLAKKRREWRENEANASSMKTDSIGPSPIDANPNHREDFTRLLDAALKKKGDPEAK